MLPDARMERITFVTRRFADLQGLRSVLLGALLLVVVLTASLLPLDSFNPFSHLGGVLGAWIAGNFLLLEAYYNRRFGRVPLVPWSRFALFYAVPDTPQTPSQEPHEDRPLTRPEAFGPLLVMSALAIESMKSVYYPGGLSLAALALAAHATWVLVRDWKFRPYYVAGVAAGAAGMGLTLATPMTVRLHTPLPPDIAIAYGPTYALVGLALIVIGLLDHRLLWQGMTRADAPKAGAPDVSMSAIRVVLSATCLSVILAYIAIAGWPTEPLYLYMALLLATTVVMIVLARRHVRQLRAGAQHPVPGGETPLPRFDTLGHLLLPLAIAGGAVVDIALRETGAPSLLAAALAASHLRIAWRDWPARGHYLLGALAASISAVHFAFVPSEGTFDWVVWFLFLISTASLIEGLRDYRLSKAPDA